jgi:hypothetical protein
LVELLVRVEWETIWIVDGGPNLNIFESDLNLIIFTLDLKVKIVNS